MDPFKIHRHRCWGWREGAGQRERHGVRRLFAYEDLGLLEVVTSGSPGSADKIAFEGIHSGLGTIDNTSCLNEQMNE